MELSTILNAELSLHKLLCLRVDLAMLASTLANMVEAMILFLFLRIC